MNIGLFLLQKLFLFLLFVARARTVPYLGNLYFSDFVLSLQPKPLGISIVESRAIYYARRDTRVNGTMEIDNISQSGVAMKSITITFSDSDTIIKANF